MQLATQAMGGNRWSCGVSKQPAAIDILITVYNGERFLAQTVESVIAQRFTDWRLIVVDDMSTDGTAAILADFAACDARVTVVSGPHLGIAAAANAGLAHVTAPLLARLDGDDIALPERLKIQYDFLQQHPDILAVGSDVYLIDENNKRLHRRRAPVGWRKISETLKTRNCMCHPSSMIRTSALRQIGGYRDKFKNSLDYDLWLRISEIGKIENIPQDLLLYRRHASQVSSSGNTHRQTIYSVAAATDYFLRKYRLPVDDANIDENETDDLAHKLVLLYRANPALEDLSSINRHVIRLLRRARGLSLSARKELSTLASSHFSLAEKLKLLLYRIGWP